MLILNDGSCTRLTSPNLNKSVVDLTICSLSLATGTTYEVLSDCGNSDHFPILLKYGLEFASLSHFGGKRCFKRANWEEYHDKVLLIIPEEGFSNYNDFRDKVNFVADQTIPKYKSNNKFKTSVPWWDDDCSSGLARRRLFINNYKFNPNLDNFLRTKKVMAETRRLFQTKKRQSFRSFCSTLKVLTS